VSPQILALRPRAAAAGGLRRGRVGARLLQRSQNRDKDQGIRGHDRVGLDCWLLSLSPLVYEVRWPPAGVDGSRWVSRSSKPLRGGLRRPGWVRLPRTPANAKPLRVRALPGESRPHLHTLPAPPQGFASSHSRHEGAATMAAPEASPGSAVVTPSCRVPAETPQASERTRHVDSNDAWRCKISPAHVRSRRQRGDGRGSVGTRAMCNTRRSRPSSRAAGGLRRDSGP